MEADFQIQIFQMSGAPLARLRVKQEQTIGQLTSALCRKAGIEDGFLLLAYDGQVLDNDDAVSQVGLNNESIVTAIRYPENFVAAAFEDGSTSVWSAESTQMQRHFEGRRGAMLAVSFMSNGLGMATGCMDSNAYLWSLTSGACERYYQGHTAGVASISCSPDGNLVATGSFDRLACIWNLASGKCVCKLLGHRGTVLSVAFSANGKLLCTGSEDASAKIWDVKEGGSAVQHGHTLQGHIGSVLSVAFTPDSHHVATGSTDGTARLWNLKGKCRQVIQVAQPELHSNIGAAGTAPVCSVSFSPDGELLATGCGDGYARIWHVRSARCERSFKANSQRVVKVQSADFSPTGSMLATGTEDGVVMLWNVISGDVRAVLYNGDKRVGVRQVTFAPGPALPAKRPE